MRRSDDARGHPREIESDPVKANALEEQVAQVQAALDDCMEANPKKLLPTVHVPSDFASTPGTSLRAMEKLMMLLLNRTGAGEPGLA
jgi:hypothetical protein